MGKSNQTKSLGYITDQLTGCIAACTARFAAVEVHEFRVLDTMAISSPIFANLEFVAATLVPANPTRLHARPSHEVERLVVWFATIGSCFDESFTI